MAQQKDQFRSRECAFTIKIHQFYFNFSRRIHVSLPLLSRLEVQFNQQTNLSRNKCCVASCDCLLRVLPPPRATNFHVANFTFCNMKICFARLVVIRATNNPAQLATQHLLRDKLQENVARITWPLTLICVV